MQLGKILRYSNHEWVIVFQHYNTQLYYYEGRDRLFLLQM